MNKREAYVRKIVTDRTETDQELQDRIEVLEKNLAYEVAQKIKLAEQLQAATATGLTLEQARWKMHAGIESRCSEEVAAEVKPVIDLVFSSLALEPEAREDKLEHLAAVTNINLITKAMLEEVGYPSHFHPADAPSWAYSVLEEEHEARTAPEAREEPTGRNWVPKEELDFYVEPLTPEACEEIEAEAREMYAADESEYLGRWPEWDSPKNVCKARYLERAEAALEAAREVSRG